MIHILLIKNESVYYFNTKNRTTKHNPRDVDEAWCSPLHYLLLTQNHWIMQFSAAFLLLYCFSFLYSGADFHKTIIPLELVGYEITKATYALYSET